MMTDCCCCLSPYWPNKIVQQSTGLLKPLIECMVHSDNSPLLCHQYMGCIKGNFFFPLNYQIFYGISATKYARSEFRVSCMQDFVFLQFQ